MILIEPTKYTKILLGKSWRKNHRWYTNAANVDDRFLFFRKMTSNRLGRVQLGDDYYDGWNVNKKSYNYGGKFYATDKVCIIGIGYTLEEAEAFGNDNYNRFLNYQRIELNQDNIQYAISRSKTYRP